MTDKPEFGTLGKSVHRDGEGFIAMCDDTSPGPGGESHTGEEWAAWIAAVLNRFPELETELAELGADLQEQYENQGKIS